MQRRRALLLLMAGLFGGCAQAPPERSALGLNRLRPAPSSRVVQMEVALIERPAGDLYLNGELWDLANEQVVPFDRKGVLADNGFRVGVIGGLPPAGLQALLTSERSCADPRRIQRQAGDPATLLLGPPLPQCRFQLLQDGQPVTIELRQGQCALRVVPTLAADGRTTLQFTPQVRHGEASVGPRPQADRAGTYSWMYQEHQPTENYAQLSWEVSLAANEYVIVGGVLDRAESLGHRFFLRADEPNPVQRLLVIRTARGPATEDDKVFQQSPPLAIQAARSGKRE